MTAFLTGLAAASAIGAVMWLVLVCLRPLTCRIFSQTWHYYTGLLPVLFLLGAARAASPLIQLIYALVHRSSVRGGGSAAFIRTSGAGLTSVIAPVEPLSFNLSVIMEAVEEQTATAAVTVEAIAPLLFGIWGIGCVLFLLGKGAAYIRFRRAVLHNSVPFMRAGCPLNIIISPTTTTPMLIGILKPVIILPEVRYSEREISLVLAHEEAHWKRRDMPIKFVLLCANAIHWFNPIVYMINYAASAFCETACDEALARSMSRAERLYYGEMILSAAEYGAGRHAAFGVRMSAGKSLKRRLMCMMKFKRTVPPLKALSVAVSLTLLLGGSAMADAITNANTDNAGYEYTEQNYTVEEVIHALPEGVEMIPYALPAEDAADTGARVLTGFYGLDLNEKTLYVEYKEPIDGRVLMPDVERDPNRAILSPALWITTVFIEDKTGSGMGWEYTASVTAEYGQLYEVNRSYILGEGLRVPFECTREDWEAGNYLQHPGFVTTSYEGHAFILGVNPEQQRDNTEEFINQVRNESGFDELAKAMVERARALHDIASAKCVGLAQLSKPGTAVNGVSTRNWSEEYVIEVLVTSTGGSRILLSFNLDTEEFLWARFEPHIRHGEDVAAAIIIPR